MLPQPKTFTLPISGVIGTITCILPSRPGSMPQYYGTSRSGATGNGHFTQAEAVADVHAWDQGRTPYYAQQAVVPFVQSTPANTPVIFNNQPIKCDCAGKCVGHMLHYQAGVTAVTGTITFNAQPSPQEDVRLMQAKLAAHADLFRQAVAVLEKLPADIYDQHVPHSMVLKMRDELDPANGIMHAWKRMLEAESALAELRATHAPAPNGADHFSPTEVADINQLGEQEASSLPWLQACESGCQSAKGGENCKRCPFPVEAGAPVDILLSKRALKALSFQERVSLCEEVGVHFSYLEAVLQQPGSQQSSLTATAFSQVVQLATLRHESVAKALEGVVHHG